MNDLITTFQERYTEWVQAVLVHLQIALSALLLSIAIGVFLAIGLKKHKKIANALLQLASVIQTIPSLAILGLLIPFIGIGALPAIIALVLYGIFPILQNTLTGFLGTGYILRGSSYSIWYDIF